MTSPLIQATAERLDAFVNTLTGMGDVSKDKSASWTIEQSPLLSYHALKASYKGSYYARRVVDLLAEDSVVRGWRVLDQSDIRATEDLRWQEINAEFSLHRLLSTGMKFSRAYGTGYLVPVTYDLAPLNRPLDLSLLYEVQDVLVFDPDEVKPQSIWASDDPGSRITDPSAYRINAALPGGAQFSGRWGEALSGLVDIHPSRVIPIVGEPLSTFDRLRHPFALGDSILQAIWLAIARADSIDAAAAILAAEAKQNVIRIPDLKAIGTSDTAAAFQLRMKILKLGQSLLNMTVLGAGEEFESRANTVSGFKDLSQTSRDALVAASGYPEAILFGKATSGLAVAPGTEQEAYHRKVQAAQMYQVRPALYRLCTLFRAARMGHFAGRRRAGRIQIEFNPLVEESLKDLSARRLIDTQRDSILAGVFSSADPALGKAYARYLATHRYGDHGWRSELPPFDPQRFLADETSPASSPPPSGGPAPSGQTPSTRSPQGGESLGGQGVDLQATNTGKGQFDSREDAEGARTATLVALVPGEVTKRWHTRLATRIESEAIPGFRTETWPHVTILFAGELAPEAEQSFADAVVDALSGLPPCRPFDYKVVAFPPNSAGETPIVAVFSGDVGHQLHEKAMTATYGLGTQRQHARFVPHMTLGYAPPGVSAEQLATVGEMSAGPETAVLPAFTAGVVRSGDRDIRSFALSSMRHDSDPGQRLLTEWVLIDAEEYAGQLYDVPAGVKAEVRQALFWKQKHPAVASMFPEIYWRQVASLSQRLQVGEQTLQALQSFTQSNHAEYKAALARARSHKQPWTERAIVRWRSWGGNAGARWALAQTFSDEQTPAQEQE